MLGNLDFPSRVFGAVHSFFVAQDVTSCHRHMWGNPLLCHGWLSFPELHSNFCTIRTHADYYCGSSWWVVSVLKASGWIWKISNTTSYSQTAHKQIPYIMVLEIFPPWASSLSAQDSNNAVLYLNSECQPLSAALQPFSLAELLRWVWSQNEFWGMLPNFYNSTKVNELPFPAYTCSFLLFLFVVCFFFCWIIQLIGWHWRAWELFPNEGSSLPAFYLSSHLTANPTLLTNHHGRAVAIHNKMLLS